VRGREANHTHAHAHGRAAIRATATSLDPKTLLGVGEPLRLAEEEKGDQQDKGGGSQAGFARQRDTMPPPANSTDKHLFPAGMQKGREYVEVFSSSGSDPTSWWHVNQNHKQKISRHYNHELRSYYMSIGANCALPKAPQTLHLLQSKLIFQIMVPGVSQGFRANIM
jgi:hypothetical protein